MEYWRKDGRYRCTLVHTRVTPERISEEECELVEHNGCKLLARDRSGGVTLQHPGCHESHILRPGQYTQNPGESGNLKSMAAGLLACLTTEPTEARVRPILLESTIDNSRDILGWGRASRVFKTLAKDLFKRVAAKHLVCPNPSAWLGHLIQTNVKM